MTNKNSGQTMIFHTAKTTLFFLMCAHVALGQICLKYTGSLCNQCSGGYQLVNNECVSITNANLNINPTLIFLDSPAQKILYSTLPVIVSIQSGNSFNQTQKNVINQYKVTPVGNSTLGNYYEIRANATSVNNFNISLTNSSILSEANAISVNPNSSTIGANDVKSNGTLISINSTSQAEVSNLTLAYQQNTVDYTKVNLQNKSQTNLTTIKQSKPQYNASDINLAAVKQTSEANLTVINQVTETNETTTIKAQAESNDTQANLTAIKQATDVSLTAIKQAIQANLTAIKQLSQHANDSEANLTAIKQAIGVSLTGIKEASSQSDVSLTQVSLQSMIPSSDVNLTQINSTNNASHSDNITLSTQNNSYILLELQQINQKLTQAGHSVDSSLTQAKLSQSINPSFTQVNQQQQQQPNESGTITLQLTAIGQQLLQINQNLTQANLKQIQSSNQSTINQNSSSIPSPSISNTTLINTNLTKLKLNTSQYQLPSSALPQNPADLSLTPVNQQIDINWIKATRQELYNLTLIPQALTQVQLKQGSNSTQKVVYTFKCTNNLTLFLEPSLHSTGSQLLYAQYTHNLMKKISNQFISFTHANKATLCFDPPFQQSFKFLMTKYNSILQNSPIFAVYYQYCGFAKMFRIFFIDDSAFPNVTVRQSSIVVDLFRMMPAEAFFSIYDNITLSTK